jgi:uncharacterized protein (DUF952 family)
MSEMIYHLTLDMVWRDAQEKGYYSPSTLASEGFVHFSKKDQILRVANTFFKNQSSITLIVVNQGKLTSQVKWEPGSDKPDELFPHVFGIINLDAVEKVYFLRLGKNGLFSLPDEIG